MHGNARDGFAVRVVVLDQLVRSDVPHLDRLVRTARDDAAAVGVEIDTVDGVLVVDEGVQRVGGRDVPEFYLLVVRARRNQLRGRIEAGTPDPVAVSHKRRHKLSGG